jgi:hypothetical protein
MPGHKSGHKPGLESKTHALVTTKEARRFGLRVPKRSRPLPVRGQRHHLVRVGPRQLEALRTRTGSRRRRGRLVKLPAELRKRAGATHCRAFLETDHNIKYPVRSTEQMWQQFQNQVRNQLQQDIQSIRNNPGLQAATNLRARYHHLYSYHYAGFVTGGIISAQAYSAFFMNLQTHIQANWPWLVGGHRDEVDSEEEEED